LASSPFSIGGIGSALAGLLAVESVPELSGITVVAGTPAVGLLFIGAECTLAVAKPLSPRLKKRGVENRPEVDEPAEQHKPKHGR
jgi:hypothetical protein